VDLAQEIAHAYARNGDLDPHAGADRCVYCLAFCREGSFVQLRLPFRFFDVREQLCIFSPPGGSL
jgi:hypothetical protein